jgi:nucleoid-associated protein YgaU
MDQKKFDQLKSKYATALSAIQQQQVRLENLHEDGGKLIVRGVAPSEEAKNRVWDQIKLVNPNADDIMADIRVEPTAQAQGGAQRSAQRTYTVKPGDTLSKISKDVYGDANKYMRIFEANRDQLKDPDKIQVGQQLVIPEAA